MKTTSGLSTYWTWPAFAALIFIVAYFGADIVDKGIALNTLTPWGKYIGLGSLLWAVILWAVWILLIHPVIDFLRLMKGKNTPKSRVKAVILDSKRYPLGSRQRDLGNDIQAYWDAGKMEEYSETLAEYEALETEATRDIVNEYSHKGALAMLISRNAMLDGVILFCVQVRMIAHLAKLYDYTPSPVFVALCMHWILITSVLQALFGDDLDEAGAELTMEAAAAFLGDTAEQFVGKFSKYTLEWIRAQVNIRMTGEIFIHALKRTGRRMTASDIMELRRRMFKESLYLKKISKLKQVTTD